jgi:hypothetical protein
LAKDEYLKANPQVLKGLARALHLAVEDAKSARAEVEQLRAASASPATFRAWIREGGRLALRWLPAPLANAVRSLVRRRRETVAGTH